MKTSAKLISALVMATATAFAVPAQAIWSSHPSRAWVGRNAVTMNRLTMMMGRDVVGIDGRHLGTVVSVDRINGMVRLRTPQGVRVSVPAWRMRRFGGNQLALNMTHREFRDMARWRG